VIASETLYNASRLTYSTVPILDDSPVSESGATAHIAHPMKAGMFTSWVAWCGGASAALATRIAAACPVCDSETGQQIRAGIAGEGLVVSIIATVLPFLVMVGVVAVVQIGGLRAKRRRLDGR
jgi:hypothetical protein